MGIVHNIDERVNNVIYLSWCILIHNLYVKVARDAETINL